MIRVRLLGGAKKAVGKPEVSLDSSGMTVFEILQALRGMSADPRLLQPNNLIVAVNGTDSAALQGEKSIAKDGDTVTIVTVVHGGSDAVVIGVANISGDAGKLVDHLRGINKDVLVQAASADAVFGSEHALGALRIALEAEKRKIMLANRVETDLLLRLACTNQISEAMKSAGLKAGSAGCIIAFSNDGSALKQFASQVRKELEVDDSAVKPDKDKKKLLAKRLGLPLQAGDGEFLQHLLERAAILVK
jgi:tRNA threonylcarbamoyladenosine modification (KEOPS) complex Cgi121 subunit/molybdopterin converting factor small subunit